MLLDAMTPETVLVTTVARDVAPLATKVIEPPLPPALPFPPIPQPTVPLSLAVT
jgi:hypothetical protein